ncbi:hypothetical protein FRC00_008148, partial [Tulasnella sp. 408]
CLDGDPELKFAQWTAALHLATTWSFDDIREKIIAQVDEMISAEAPLDRIDASLKCRVEKWLHPAYVILCKRERGLSDAEAESLSNCRTAPMPSKDADFGDASYLIFLIPLRLLQQSQYFRDMIGAANTGSEGEGKSDEHPIRLDGISAFEMRSFLKAVDSPFIYGDPKLVFREWGAALHLATMWNFEEIRKGIITTVDKTISSANPFERIEVSIKCQVEKWLHPAYEALCTRAETLSDPQAEWLGIRRSAAIWRIRERCFSDQLTFYRSKDGRKGFGRQGDSEPRPTNFRALIEGEEALKFPS